jgi:pimeloyl-ACP methyl ester carboxylesterase
MQTVASKKIFIVHGWTYSTDSWQKCIADLRQRGFEPVMLHVPGLTEKSDKVWTLDDYVEWLCGKLAGEKNVVLLGHSNGGRIALAYIEKYPTALARLILLDAAGIVQGGLFLRMKRKIGSIIAQIGKATVPVSFAATTRKFFYRLLGARDYEQAPVNMRATMANLITVDLEPLLSSISVPTFIIWGQRDNATPVADAHLIHEKIKDSKLFIISDARHSPHITHSQVVASEIAAWLR